MSRKVLVVDDEKLIVKGIRFSLEQDGMEVDCAYDGEEAVEKAKDKKYDIILLDLMLPKMDGLEVCQQIREFSNVPIVMLTAKGEDMDKILGLEYGADDYITKPYALAIVKVHIEAILKRAGKQKERVEVGHIAVEPDTWRVYVDEKAIETTPKEYELLSYLIKNKNVVMTRDSILESVWGYDYSGDTRTVDTLVKQLRRKIAPYGSYIRSVYGVGYIFEGEENETAEA